MKALKVRVDGGYLIATESGDVDYPGICVEFISDDMDDDVLSVPSVLIEKPVDDELRVLIWADEDNEDYTTKITFN